MWRTLTTDGITPREDAFDVLDWALSMCEKYGLYAILDHHGAIGSQNMDFHSGNDEQLGLYGSPEYKGKTIAMWKMIAERYRGREVVLGYDLLNECRVAPGNSAGGLRQTFILNCIRRSGPWIRSISFSLSTSRSRSTGEV